MVQGRECYAPCSVQVKCFGGGSVKVWAGMHDGGRTVLLHRVGVLMNIRYRDKIL